MLNTRKNPLFIEVTTEVSAVVSGGGLVNTGTFSMNEDDTVLYITLNGQTASINSQGNQGEKQNSNQNISLIDQLSLM
ncbi:MAG: hypothetical protein QNJ36_11885 [Calothrix sp. MO_167.B42]|nr:hypothetical protein [Calothrix sp. MO_167.B42]